MQYTLRGAIANTTPLTLDKTLSLEGASADAKAVGDAIKAAEKRTNDTLAEHKEKKDNPHEVTAEQVGLGNVNNTSDMDKPVSTEQAEAIADAKKAGTDAQTAAEEAKEAADNAQSTADEAKAAAEEAKTAADEAKTASEEVKTAAEEVKTYADSLHKVFTATIPASGWTDAAPYAQVVSVPGVKEEDYPHIFPVYSETADEAEKQMEAWSMVTRGTSGTDNITFYCSIERPDVDIPIQIEVNR